MKVSLEELRKRGIGFGQEVMASMKNESIMNVTHNGYVDVKLIIDGIECEPTLLKDLLSNIDYYVKAEAQKLLDSELLEAKESANKLKSIIYDTIENIETLYK